MSSPPRACAEIDLSALDHNLAFARRHSGQQVMAVLKAGAYGHGLSKLAKHLDDKNLPYFGVANVHEARLLADDGIQTAIYLLGASFPEEREEIVLRGWTPCLSSLSEIDDFTKICIQYKKHLTAHLAIDTGMGRGGFLPEQVASALQHLALPQNNSIQLTGVGSHLPSADEDEEFTKAQFDAFDRIVSEHFPQRNDFHIHLSNSAGLLDYQSLTANLIRPGLMLYGISPLPAWQKELRPVMSLKSRVSLVRTLPKGHGISYGRTSILEKDTAVATIGVGYGDGYPRNVSGQGAYVLINGEKAPLLGRVTMDQIMADVSHLPNCQSGDQVELFGSNLPVSQVAQWADTIAWEVLTRITPRVTRAYKTEQGHSCP